MKAHTLKNSLAGLYLLCFVADHSAALKGRGPGGTLSESLSSADFYYGTTTQKHKSNKVQEVLPLVSTVSSLVTTESPKGSSLRSRHPHNPKGTNTPKRKTRGRRTRRKLFDVDQTGTFGFYSKGNIASAYSDSDTSGTTEIEQWGSTSATPQTVTCTIDYCTPDVATLQFSLKFGSIFTSISDGVDVTSGTSCPLTVSATTLTSQDVYTMVAITSGSGLISYAYECTEAPAPTSAPTTEPGDDMNCFSATSSVQVHQQGPTPMQDLQLGDLVLVSGNKYEPVYSWGHKQQNQEAAFLQICTNKGKPLEVTGNHLVHVVLDERGSGHMVPARTIKVGDMIQQYSQAVAVTRITTVTRKGLYMPLTPSGTIIVDDIFASAYVSLQNEVPEVVETSKMFPLVTDSTILHWWLSPYRMLCLGVSPNLCQSEVLQEDGVLSWLKAGKAVAVFAESQGLVPRVLLGLPIFLIFGFLNLCETALAGPSSAPLLAMGVGFLFALFWKQRKPASEIKVKEG